MPTKSGERGSAPFTPPIQGFSRYSTFLDALYNLYYFHVSVISSGYRPLTDEIKSSIFGAFAHKIWRVGQCSLCPCPEYAPKVRRDCCKHRSLTVNDCTVHGTVWAIVNIDHFDSVLLSRGIIKPNVIQYSAVLSLFKPHNTLF